MQRITDLSGTLATGLWGYHELPGLEQVLPRFEVEPVATVARDSFFASRITATTISGTYLESAAHIIDGGRTLDQYPVERLVRPARLVRLPAQEPRALIDADLMAKHAPRIERGDALLVATGWGRMWNRPGYVLTCPNMQPSALQWVLEHEISLFGVDIPCIEAAWSEDDPGEKGGLLGKLFERDILLLAPLVNLEQVGPAGGTLYCLPLKLAGTSGAPCRAIIVEDA